MTLAGCSRRRDALSDQDGSPTKVPTGEMTYRTHPRTGDKVSLLGYGAMRLPRRGRLGVPAGAGPVDQDAVNASVDYALAHGVNYFDTAPVYCQGGSERVLGAALSRHPRDRYFVATKMSNLTPQPSREDSLAMYRRSLDALRVDHLDYYLLHTLSTVPVFKERFLDNGVLDFLLQEREAGRIRHLGWSFHGDPQLFDYMLATGVPWDFVQIQANYLDWNHLHGRNTLTAKHMYEELTRAGIPVIVMEPLLGSRLARLPHQALVQLKQAAPEASTASWAFRFVGSLPNVLTVLSGMTFLENVQDNVCTYSPLQPLTPAELQMLEQAAQVMLASPTVGCTGCQYCMPCPYGIDIPGVFGHYDRCLAEGVFPNNAADPGYRRARRVFLVGMDRSVARLRQAEHCTGCGTCLPRCPQKIDIPGEMRKIDGFSEHLMVTA